MRTKIIVGLGYGDEGKGMTVCHETEKALENGKTPIVARYNGGPQAAHNVRIRDSNGRIIHHTFSQFGSGTLRGAKTILTNGMLIDVLGIAREAEKLQRETGNGITSFTSRIAIDSNAPIVVPLHAIVNRILENDRDANGGRHGSTGMGIGVARECEKAWRDYGCDGEPLTVSLLADPDTLFDALVWWKRWCEWRFCIQFENANDKWLKEQAYILFSCYRYLISNGMTIIDDSRSLISELCDDSDTGMIFEGSQGMMLDERYGFSPFVSYGDMTPSNALSLINGHDNEVIGVTRTYSTRHGYGPFPPEGTFAHDEPDNAAGKWQGEFRTGLLDVPTLRRCCMKAGCDSIALSFSDVNVRGVITKWLDDSGNVGFQRVPSSPVITRTSYWQDVAKIIEDALGIPIRIVGCGNTSDAWCDLS